MVSVTAAQLHHCSTKPTERTWGQMDVALFQSIFTHKRRFGPGAVVWCSLSYGDANNLPTHSLTQGQVGEREVSRWGRWKAAESYDQGRNVGSRDVMVSMTTHSER